MQRGLAVRSHIMHRDSYIGASSMSHTRLS